MSATHSSPSVVGFVAEAPAKLDISARRVAHATGTWQDSLEHPDVLENKLRRRARLQALALMGGSSVLSIGAIYGAWTLLAHIV
jgi:hypothetical protein